jgi:hypothetical protein
VCDDHLVADLTPTVAVWESGDFRCGIRRRLIETPGLPAFAIKDDFLRDDDPSGFSLLIRRRFAEKSIPPLTEKHYRHRQPPQDMSWIR